MMNKNDIVSLWKSVDILYQNEGFYVIYGEYEDMDSLAPALGMCWEKYPISHGKLAPIVLETKVAKAVLLGLASMAVGKNNKELLDKINKISDKIFI